MRRGMKVRYIGNDELAKGMTFMVIHRHGNCLEIMFPYRASDGSIQKERCFKRMTDFEIIKED